MTICERERCQMPSERGPHLYKFMTAATAKAVLEGTKLRWSTPRTFNDPFDVQFDMQFKVDREKVRNLALQKVWNDQYEDNPPPPGNAFGRLIRFTRGRFPKWDREQFDAEFSEALDQGLDQGLASLPQLQADTRAQMRDSKILCLTVAPKNLLMWTHYAGQHTGAVLRFRDVPGLDSPWSEARAVNYVAEMPLLADDDLLSDIMAGRASFDMKLVIDRLVYTKYEAFIYEQEWRIYSGSGRNPEADFEDLGFDPLELDAIILGARMSQNDREEITALARRFYPHVEIQRADLADSRFEVNILPG